MGGAGAVVLAVAGAIALDRDAALGSTCGENAGRTCSDAEVADLRSAVVAADVGLAITVVGAAAGVALAIASAVTSPGEGEVAVVPVVTPQASILVLRGSL